MIHSKLVRDLVPELFGQEGPGTLHAVRQLEDDEFLSALITKLIEEAVEVRSASSVHERVKELADVVEVVRALTLALTTPEHVEEVRRAKAAVLGTFANRIWMTWEDAEE